MKIRRVFVIVLVVMCLMSTSVFSATKASASSMDETAARYLKPIQGVRKIVKNKSGLEKKARITKKIKKGTKKIISTKKTIEKEKEKLKAYKKVKDTTDATGTIFANGVPGDDLFYEVSTFDKYFQQIVYYGNVNEEFLTSNNYLTLGVNRTQIPAFGAINSEESNVVALLKANGTEAVDIKNYLSSVINLKKEKISKLRVQLKKERIEVKSLKKQSKKTITKDIVFNSNNITEVSNISKTEMRALLQGTALEKYADSYVEIEKEYGINAIAFCALSALESGWGESRRAIEDNNYTGYGVYSNSSSGINAGSGEANLWMTARCLYRLYLHEGDTYYHGKGLDGVNRSYSATSTWAYDIEKIGSGLMDELA